jgi:acetate kinase
VTEVAGTTAVVINCGSSSVKLDVFVFAPSAIGDPRGAAAASNPLSAQVERVGKPGTRVAVTRQAGTKEDREVEAHDVPRAVSLLLDEVLAAGYAPDVVGHRVVHGGDRFSESVLVSEDVLAELRACVPLAPLHNPANIAGIETAAARLPRAPHVAVFDTAFHQTLAPDAYLYAIPRAFHEGGGVRRYGFHGTSHRYVAERAAALLRADLGALRLITLHLGNGCSACAIDGGRSIDTSMGMTPLEGLVMGTRSGDVDPAIVLRLARERGVEGAEKVLNHESGLLGLSRKSHDMRDLEAAAQGGDADADLAIRVFARRAKKIVGAYAAVLGGLDGLVFTGGIGENSVRVRRDICRGLDVLGAVLDEQRNASADRGERDLASSQSRARILVIPTDEELAIAQDAIRLLTAS